jgi:hypothetical protein
MPVEHVIFDEQGAAWKTPVVVDKAMPVRSFSIDPGVAYVDERATGTGRATRYTWLGPKLPTGSIEMVGWYEQLGYFLKAAGLHDIASTQQAATSAYLHGFLPKDDTMPLGLSMQAKRDADDADNLVGVIFNTMTLTCTAGEPLVISGDFVAYDSAPTGGTWNFDDSTGAPAVIASPSYFATTVLPYRFQMGSLVYGAALTFDDTENKYTKVGTDAATIETISITWENNYDPRVFLGNRVAGNVIGQDFNVSGTFDLDQSTVTTTFRDLYRAGTSSTIWLQFASGVEADTGYDYDMTVVVPKVYFPQAALPDISGENDRRMQSVEFTGYEDDDGNAINITLIDTATSY